MMDQQAKQPTIKEQKRFSVIITAFNIKDYIRRAIVSVENQTFKNIEIIVVGGFSIDGTEQEIENICKEYKNINYIEQTGINKRAGGTRNRGLEVATGEYIIFLDGDDHLAENDVLERLDKVLGNDEVDVTYLGFEIEGDRSEIVIPTEETCTKTIKAASDKYPNVWSKCWRRKFLEENNIKYPEERFYEDVLFVYNGVMKSKSYKIADFVVHKYTSGRQNSMTTTLNLKNVDDTIANIKDFLKMREEEYTKEIDIILEKETRMCKKRLDDVMSKILKK